jgi:acyl-CoA reductase-like NAD-dependent aldehyde dehydrogenase
MQTGNDPLAIPLWINGHAYLTMAASFFDIRNQKTGEVMRRTPLCGANEAATAVAAAKAALPRWSAETVATRAALLTAVGEALAGYSGHFAGLIAEETGQENAAASAEVAEAVALLLGASAAEVSGVVAIVSDDFSPLLGPLSRAAPALLAGATVVIKPSPKAPSAIFALAELTARCNLPCGVFNILQGDDAAVNGLCMASDVDVLLFSGKPALAAKIGAIAIRYGKSFVA